MNVAENDGAGKDGAGADRTCPHGPDLAHELRALALAALDRIDPLLARLRDAVVDGAAPGDGAACPICATLAAVRAGRPEPTGRLAAHAAELAAALREALADRDGAAEPEAARTARPVQRIRVEREPAAGCDRSGHDASTRHSMPGGRPAPDRGGTSC